MEYWGFKTVRGRRINFCFIRFIENDFIHLNPIFQSSIIPRHLSLALHFTLIWPRGRVYRG